MVSKANFHLAAGWRLRRSILRAGLRFAFHILARVRLCGFENIAHGTPYVARVGKPFALPQIEGRGAARRLARQRNADLVMQRIAGLPPPEYRGVYSDSGIPVI